MNLILVKLNCPVRVLLKLNCPVKFFDWLVAHMHTLAHTRMHTHTHTHTHTLVHRRNVTRGKEYILVQCHQPSSSSKTLCMSLSHYPRLSWAGLVKHPFWQGELAALAKEFVTSQDMGGPATPATQSSIFEHNTSSVLGRIKGVELHRSIDRSVSRLDAVDSARPCKCFKKKFFLFVAAVAVFGGWMGECRLVSMCVMYVFGGMLCVCVCVWREGVCVCVCVCMCVCVCVCVCVSVCGGTWLCNCVFVMHVHACMCVCTSMCWCLFLSSPWYNRTGWLDIKHQLTYIFSLQCLPLVRCFVPRRPLVMTQEGAVSSLSGMLHTVFISSWAVICYGDAQFIMVDHVSLLISTMCECTCLHVCVCACVHHHVHEGGWYFQVIWNDRKFPCQDKHQKKSLVRLIPDVCKQ